MATSSPENILYIAEKIREKDFTQAALLLITIDSTTRGGLQTFMQTLTNKKLTEAIKTIIDFMKTSSEWRLAKERALEISTYRLTDRVPY